MYNRCFIIIFVCGIGSSLEDGTSGSWPSLDVLLSDSHFKNSSPSRHAALNGISEQQLDVKHPKSNGSQRPTNQSISSDQHENYTSLDPKHDSRQMGISNFYFIESKRHSGRTKARNSSISANNQEITGESPLKTTKGKYNSPRLHMSLLNIAQKIQEETTVQNLNGVNNSSPLWTKGNVVLTAEPCTSKRNLDLCLARATAAAPALRGLPHTPTQLLHMCQLFNGGMKCVDDYTTRCLAPEKRALLEDNIVGARSFLTFLCNEPSFQRDYLSHALCLKAVSGHWDNCYHHFQYLLRLELLATTDSNFDAICCVRQKFMMCVDAAADMACSSDDATFLKKVTATLSYAEHRTLMCQRAYSCSRGQANRSFVTCQLDPAAAWLLLGAVWLWSRNDLE